MDFPSTPVSQSLYIGTPSLLGTAFDGTPPLKPPALHQNYRKVQETLGFLLGSGVSPDTKMPLGRVGGKATNRLSNTFGAKPKPEEGAAGWPTADDGSAPCYGALVAWPTSSEFVARRFRR